jgi:CMD domain protein
MERKKLMSEAKAESANAGPDLLNELLGIDETSHVGSLRSQRKEIAGYIQGSYVALLQPQDEAGVSRTERGLLALRVAVLEHSAPLIAHYRDYLAQADAASDLVAAAEQRELAAPLPLPSRLIALLEHVDRLTLEPAAATPQHLQGLKAHGLSDANIVTISQLIAFVSFQVRALVGLQLLGES